MRQILLPPTQLAPQTDRDEHFVPQTQKALAKTDPTPRSSTPTINYLGTMRLIEALRPLLAKSSAPRISVTTSAATLQDNDPQLFDLLREEDSGAALARGRELAEQ